MAKIKLEIITPKNIFFNDFVEIAVFRTIIGDIGILAQHQPFISKIIPCQISYRQNNQQFFFQTTGGILFTTKTKIQFITDSIYAVKQDKL